MVANISPVKDVSFFLSTFHCCSYSLIYTIEQNLVLKHLKGGSSAVTKIGVKLHFYGLDP